MDVGTPKESGAPPLPKTHSESRFPVLWNSTSWIIRLDFTFRDDKSLSQADEAQESRDPGQIPLSGAGRARDGLGSLRGSLDPPVDPWIPIPTPGNSRAPAAARSPTRGAAQFPRSGSGWNPGPAGPGISPGIHGFTGKRIPAAPGSLRESPRSWDGNSPRSSRSSASFPLPIPSSRSHLSHASFREKRRFPKPGPEKPLFPIPIPAPGSRSQRPIPGCSRGLTGELAEEAAEPSHAPFSKGDPVAPGTAPGKPLLPPPGFPKLPFSIGTESWESKPAGIY